MINNTFYKEKRDLEDEDMDYESPIYSATIYDKSFLLTVGQERKLTRKKNHYYFPLYLMDKKFVHSQIGALEYKSTEIDKEKRLKPYLDESGDLDLNKFDTIVFYSFADYEFFDNAKNVYVSPATLSALESEKSKITVNYEEDEPIYDVEYIEEEPYELTSEDMEKSVKTKSTDLKHDVFSIERSTKPIITLPEETEQEAKREIQEYNEKNDSVWIAKHMKNNHYSIEKTLSDGDCLFHTIQLAYQQIGYITSIEQLRAIVAKEATEDMFLEYSFQYKLALGENIRLQTEISKLKTTSKDIQKRIKQLHNSNTEERQKLEEEYKTISNQ